MKGKQIKKKICLLGLYGVGKTSLVRQFVYNKFEEKYLSTIGVNISKKSIELTNDFNENILLEFFIWDIANIEKFDTVTQSYLSGAHGAIVVSDILRESIIPQTIEYTNKFLEINNNSKIILVGNKFDLADKNSFDSDNYISKLSSLNLPFYFTSAKTGENVENVFHSLGKSLI
ncbi:MAG: GTP-binding protein [Ignavibacteriales bacterium]|nr:GTP-binding protein [Ignavibacteriales bacterium]MCB9218806.1 GTP-binding protein [Ignavibacteriales bacterium]